MIIYPKQVTAEDTLFLDETLPATILELDEPLARQHAPIEAHLTVCRDGESLIVTGRIQTVLQLRCGRCADWIDWPIDLPHFTILLESPLPDTIDLTAQVREDILLDLPVAASCRLDADERCPLSGKQYPTASEPPPVLGQDAWKELDKLTGRE
jgi:uncharacterized metal-binding protein YceD (DUF177 family)